MARSLRTVPKRDPSTSFAAVSLVQDDKIAMLFCQLFIHFRECVRRELQIFARMRSRHLRPDACGTVWHDRIEEADHVNAFLQHPRSELLRLCRVANHYGNDWMDTGFDR